MTLTTRSDPGAIRSPGRQSRRANATRPRASPSTTFTSEKVNIGSRKPVIAGLPPAVTWRGEGSSLDELEHLEHRQVHRDDDRADHDSDADHHQRLDDRGQRLDARVDLVLVEVG